MGTSFAEIRTRVVAAWRRLTLSPGRHGLSAWLVLTNVTMVVAVAAFLSWSGIGRLRDLSHAQALSRVQLAGAVAREEMRRLGEDLLASARTLAERPTLQRLLAEGPEESIAPFVRRFCEAGAVEACAIVAGDRVIAQSGPELPWLSILARAGEQGESFLVSGPDLARPVQGAVTRMTSSRVRVVVASQLGDRMEQLLAAQAGAGIRLVDYRSYVDGSVGDTAPVHMAGLADGRTAARRVDSLGAYLASVPVLASTGEVAALIEASVPTGNADAAVDQLVRSLLTTALVVAVLGSLAALVLGRRVADPLAQLNEAAHKLGQGDFSLSIPVGGSREVVQLAHTMEAMRRNLIDLTDTLRAREAQAQSMLGGISHEFRTPLAAQLAAIELLKSGLGTMPVEEARELMTTLERSVLRLMRLIDNLLENVRIEAGTLAIRRQPVSVARVIEEACDLVRVLLEQRAQTLDVEVPEDLPSIEGDEQRLIQVFVNLLANANKFAPDGSVIHVRALADPAQVRVQVEDHGPGSPGIVTGEIFERFNRGGREPRQSGLGLGLWISRSIVERHGGTITAERTPDGRTRFTVTLDTGVSA